MNKGPRPRLLIAGCGDLGSRLPARLPAWHIHGLRRHPSGLAAPIVPIRADLDDAGSLEAVTGSWDAVVYTATPAERTPAAYRKSFVEGLENLLAQVRTPRLVFVSSTAVYGQDAGEWVDEDSATWPRGFNGRILLEAEGVARRAGGTVVRFSGIYGPGREYLINQLLSGPVAARREPPVWTNRIHADDCAAVLAHLVELERPEGLYCASDALPAPRWDVLSWLAARLDAAGPVAVADDGRGQGRRVCAERLFNTGLELRFPDFRAGYGAVLGLDSPDPAPDH